MSEQRPVSTEDYVKRELARLDEQTREIQAEMRGDPLTPEDEARIRNRERRRAREHQIYREEWARVQGFPYWPPWIFPVFVVAVLIVVGVAFFAVGYLVAHAPR